MLKLLNIIFGGMKAKDLTWLAV